MSNFKVNIKKGFTQIPNQVINDPNLKWSSKGVFCYLMSRPEGWSFYMNEIVKHSNMGMEALRSCIKELIATGYLIRTKSSFEDKSYNYELVLPNVAETPMLVKQAPNNTDLINNTDSITSTKVEAGSDDPVYVEIDEDFSIKPNKAIQSSGYGNREVQGIIKKRRQLKWSAGFGGVKIEPQQAKHLLDLDDYATIIEVMEKYEARRGEAYMKAVSNLDDLYKNYAAIRTKVLDNGVPPDVMKKIIAYVRGNQKLDGSSEEEATTLIAKKVNRYKETGSWM